MPPAERSTVVSHPGGDAAYEEIATVELIPGHAVTAAEVWLWHGETPGVSADASTRVVLSVDDWPMSSSSARQLAAALVVAAKRAEEGSRLIADEVS